MNITDMHAGDVRAFASGSKIKVANPVVSKLMTDHVTMSWSLLFFLQSCSMC